MESTEAIDNAVRLLQNAEVETNLAISESITRIAEAWLNLAAMLRE